MAMGTEPDPCAASGTGVGTNARVCTLVTAIVLECARDREIGLASKSEQAHVHGMANTHLDPEEYEYNGLARGGRTNASCAWDEDEITGVHDLEPTGIRQDDLGLVLAVSTLLEEKTDPQGYGTRLVAASLPVTLETTRVCRLCECEVTILVAGLCWSCTPSGPTGRK